jgi:enoyl-CoA hydratase
MDGDMLRLQVTGQIAELILDRPHKHNAMTAGFWGQLREALATVRAEGGVRVVVLRGEGPSFCSGGDIGSFGDLGTVAARRRYQDEAMSAFRALDDLPIPTIAAVHGLALGGGCELTLVCDLVVADETAQFGLPEAIVGLVPGLGVVRGRAHVGLHALKFLVMTGERMDAHEARSVGLVNRVVPEGEHVAEVHRLAEAIAARSPLAMQVGKRILNRGNAEGDDWSVEAVSLLHGSDDQAEGIAAFRERRAPSFGDVR